MISILRRAFTLVRFRIVVSQLGLVTLVFLLFAVWLRVPDSSISALVASLLLAVFTLALATFGETISLRRLRTLASTRRDLLRGALAILLAVLLWFAWSAWLDHLSLSDFQRAGYFNSRFPHTLRNVFSYAHLLKALQCLWASLFWIGTGFLVVMAVAAAQSARYARAMLYVWRSGTYWIVLFISAVFTSTITASLLRWTPGHGLRSEAVSLVLRLGTIIIVDVLLACFVLAVVTVLVERAEASYMSPAGTPEASQPRTADTP